MNAPRRQSRSRSQAKGTDTLARITAAARDVFYEKGFFAASVDEIAKRGEVSRATVYLHFKGKDEILAALLSEDLDYQLSKYEELIAIKRLSVSSVRTWLLGFCEYIAEQSQSLGLFWTAGALRSAGGELAGPHRDNVVALLGTRFKGFDLDALDRSSRELQRYRCHMMLFVIEGIAMNFPNRESMNLNSGVRLLAPILLDFLKTGRIADRDVV